MIKGLEKVIPKDLLTYIVDTFNMFDINTILRVSHFLSQVKHESGNFKFREENLNYSAEALLRVFPKYFPTIEVAKQYERNPQKIASRVYANRMGNGSEETQEGWKFRGRGFIQLTGKDNYKEFGDYIKQDLLNNPDLVSTLKYSSLSAGWFWYKKGLNKIADKGDSVDVVKEITKKINGGLIGLEDRINKFKTIYSILREENV